MAAVTSHTFPHLSKFTVLDRLGGIPAALVAREGVS